MTAIVILAAGKGKRMGSEIPKVLQRIDDHTLIEHLLEGVTESGICRIPVLVVGFGAEKIKAVIGPRAEYVTQDEQKGTGHAVASARALLEGKSDDVIVLYGDHPFVGASTLRKLHLLHEQSGGVLTMMTVHLEDFNDWRAPFADFGRIVRDDSGKIIAIVEKRDSNAVELAIHELNPALYCFDAKWLWENVEKLTDNNAQGELLLTDLARMAIEQGHTITSVEIDPFECLGVNTPEHLAMARKLAHQNGL